MRIVGCAAGDSFTQLVSDDGRVFATGENDNGQLGTGDTTAVNTPTEIDAAHFGGAPVATVVCGCDHTMVITRGEGKLYCWGDGEYGATGLGHTDNVTTPQAVVGALTYARIVRIAAGFTHSCALAEDGRVFAFGDCAGIPAAGRQGTPQLLQGALAAGTTVCALSTGCYAQHAAFIEGPPPAAPGFEAPLVFAMQKPAAKEPDPAAVAALAALRPPDEGGGAAAASSSAAADSGAASAGSEQGTKRKRDGPSDDDDDESGAHEEGGEDAAPLC